MASENPPTTLILIVVSLVVFLHGNVNAMSSIKAMSKDQIACEFCSDCDNPCQPAYSPPPPPPSSNCPPPPSPLPVCPPPPPDAIPIPHLPPDVIPMPRLEPPNPIVPYFPFYYYSPPPPGYSVESNSIASAKPTDSILYLLLISCFISFQI